MLPARLDSNELKGKEDVSATYSSCGSQETSVSLLSYHIGIPCPDD